MMPASQAAVSAAVSVAGGRGGKCPGGPRAQEALDGAVTGREPPHTHTQLSEPAPHSPFPVPDLGHQLLVALAQRGLLVGAHQAATLQEELGQWRAGAGAGEKQGRSRGGAAVRQSWEERQEPPAGMG